MANINLINIGYLFFRLAPFIIVCFFVMDSIINNSLRGVVYLAGLLFGCFVTILISRSIAPFFGKMAEPSATTPGAIPVNPQLAAMNEPTNYDCNALTLGENGPISILPLNQTVFGFTFSYLLVLIASVDTDNTGLMITNIPMIILFSILILADFAWNMIQGCTKNAALPVIAGGMGALFGVAWASVLTANKLTQFYYVTGTSTKEVCSVPTKKSFKCWKSSSANNAMRHTPIK